MFACPTGGMLTPHWSNALRFFRCRLFPLAYQLFPPKFAARSTIVALEESPVTDILLLVVLVVVLTLTAAATRAVMQDEYSEGRQKILQTAVVWLVPFLGALLVLGVHRKAEKPSGAYRRDDDGVGDDFGTHGRGIRALKDSLDDD